MITEERLAELMFKEIKKHNLQLRAYSWYLSVYIMDGFKYCVENKLDACNFLNIIVRKDIKLIKPIFEYISKNEERIPGMKDAIKTSLGRLLVLV
jgi:hypothetical protein